MSIKNAILFIISMLVAGHVSIAQSIRADKGPTIEKDKGNFIELSDGSLITGQIGNVNYDKFISGGKNGSLTVGDKKYDYRDIIAVQKGGDYYRKDGDNKFSERIIKGRINVYKRHHNGTNLANTGGNATFDYAVYYLQKGDGFPLVELKWKVLEDMLRDYRPALDAYNELSRHEKKYGGENDLNHVFDIYNKR